MSTDEKIEKAIEILDSIYNDFDEMNGYLHEVIAETPIDTNGMGQLARIWVTFPTWSTLDELKNALQTIKLKESVVSE